MGRVGTRTTGSRGRCSWTAGKSLGGCSLVSLAVYTLPLRLQIPNAAAEGSVAGRRRLASAAAQPVTSFSDVSCRGRSDATSMRPPDGASGGEGASAASGKTASGKAAAPTEEENAGSRGPSVLFAAAASRCARLRGRPCTRSAHAASRADLDQEACERGGQRTGRARSLAESEPRVFCPAGLLAACGERSSNPVPVTFCSSPSSSRARRGQSLERLSRTASTRYSTTTSSHGCTHR